MDPDANMRELEGVQMVVRLNKECSVSLEPKLLSTTSHIFHFICKTGLNESIIDSHSLVEE